MSDRRWTYARRSSQVACLAIFLWLFLQTEYRGIDELPYPVSLLFRLDPLAALADFLAPGPFGWALLWPALLVLLLTALFGRFFCGWVCPLGTTLDGCGRLVGRGRRPFSPGWRRVKYSLLVLLIGAALFGVQLLGLFDPLAIFLRSLTLALYPAYNLALNGLFDFFYQQPVPLLSPLVNDAYPLFRDHLMAFYQPVFTLGLFTLLVFLGIVLLEKVEQRFWCKNLCPLGALLGLCSRYALVQRTPQTLCADCRQCDSLCRSGAVRDGRHRRSECLLCMDCVGFCPEERVRFGLRPGGNGPGVDLSRRGLLTAFASGVILAPAVRIGPVTAEQNPYLLRPPGAVAEAEFLQRCVRCAECMKVCIGRALHPAFLDAGPVGLWTPLLVPRIGYCEYNCTLCGQVCPTGAIERLDLPRKQKAVIGLAVFDKNRCLPFAKSTECLVCEEHCPTGEKAIVFEEREVLVDGELRRLKFPRVVDRLCIGCGICETVCPLEGASAIRVINEGESRRPRPLAAGDGYG
ncbi:MAG: 4Fe-4S binding protein [Desulfuromonadales bacterium]|nr:4Fe-4S binding protein [Desulfuromonadales bacterium]